nr:hypothetical protein [Tanacetum cinerariifolium]
MSYTRDGGEESVMSTQEYIRKVYEDMGEDDDFTRGSWLSVVEYVNVDGGIMSGCFGDIKRFLNNGKLEKVIAIITSCTPNALGNLTVTLKDLSSTISGVIILDQQVVSEPLGSTSGIRACALRNFNLEVMEFKSEQNNTTAKLPILKLESLDSIFNRLQKIVSRLAILGVIITQQDLNSKFLRSLPPEWNTHVVVWMNKADIETMCIDDLYNNFKIIKQDVRKSVGTSTGAQNIAFMTALSTSSTNDVNTANPAYEASTVSSNVNTASPQVSTANFSDNAVYAFMVETPNGSNLLQQDLEQIHKDDREAMDLRWQLSLIIMRVKGSQISDNSKKGLGYHAVPPPDPLIYNRPTKLDLSNSGLDEFKKPEFKGYGPRDSKLESNVNHDQKSNDSKENSDDSFVKQQILEDISSSVESPLNVDKETVFSVDKKIEFIKPKNYDKPVRKSVRYAEMYRSQRPRGNQRNWNGQKSNQLGSDFVMYNKVCFSCGSFSHVHINCTHHQSRRRVSGINYNKVDYNYYAKTTHPSAQRNMTPRAVLLKTGLIPFNIARRVYTAHPKQTVHNARPMSHFSKQAQSTVQRPFYKQTALTNRYFHQKANTARLRVFNTARPYIALVNTVRAKRINVVKASAWKSCNTPILTNIAAKANLGASHKMMVKDLLKVDAQGT